jgi:hypothetical protein
VALLRGSAGPGSSSDIVLTEPLGPASETRLTRLALVVQVNDGHVMLLRAGMNQVPNLTFEEFDGEFTGTVLQFALVVDALNDPDGARGRTRSDNMTIANSEHITQQNAIESSQFAYAPIGALPLL